MDIQRISIKDLNAYDKNQRIHDEEQIQKLKASIKEYGMLQPIVLSKNNEIIVGHARAIACKELGYKDVPCIYAYTLTEDQIKRYRIADNKIGDLSFFDDKLLNEELNEILNTPNFNLESLGFNNEELNKILAYTEEYIPVYEPETEDLYREVTKEDIEKEREQREKQMEHIKKYEYVICPKCYHEFEM